jgi:hypothetical protein
MLALATPVCDFLVGERNLFDTVHLFGLHRAGIGPSSNQ